MGPLTDESFLASALRMNKGRRGGKEQEQRISEELLGHIEVRDEKRLAPWVGLGRDRRSGPRWRSIHSTHLPMQETQRPGVHSLGQDDPDPLEGNAATPVFFTWRLPWTESLAGPIVKRPPKSPDMTKQPSVYFEARTYKIFSWSMRWGRRGECRMTLSFCWLVG